MENKGLLNYVLSAVRFCEGRSSAIPTHSWSRWSAGSPDSWSASGGLGLRCFAATRRQCCTSSSASEQKFWHFLCFRVQQTRVTVILKRQMDTRPKCFNMFIAMCPKHKSEVSAAWQLWAPDWFSQGLFCSYLFWPTCERLACLHISSYMLIVNSTPIIFTNAHLHTGRPLSSHSSLSPY